MGLFDSWRRRKRAKTERTQVKAREILTTESAPSMAKVPEPELTPEIETEVVSLVAEYEKLILRRDELQKERVTLTNQLDDGAINAIEFRKELMKRIQEAAQVSERIKEVSTRLIELGYRGVLH